MSCPSRLRTNQREDMSSNQSGTNSAKGKVYTATPRATWPYRLSSSVSQQEIERLRGQAERLSAQSQYGWGHTIDFGPFRMEGLLHDNYLRIAGHLDEWEWWPASLERTTVADVGCFTGGLSLLLAARGADRVFAVDEIPAHLAQCAFVAGAFDARSVECLELSLYELPKRIEPLSLDLILLSGVLYHLSDMLVGLVALQTLLKPSGVLIIESFAVNCFEHSYANFGRFVGGSWWHPTALCIQDLCEFSGLSRPEVRFYTNQRCLARAIKPADPKLPFKRGMNWPFADRRDEVPRTVDHAVLTPDPCDHSES